MSKFETARFGTLDVPEGEPLEFSRGILGFETLKRFVHVEMEHEYPFGWLQSLDDPNIAFVVANPALFFREYRVEVDPRELGDVRPGPNENLLVLGICTIPESLRDVTMNLQGPLVINLASRRGKQLVLNHSGYATQHRLTESSRSQDVAHRTQGRTPQARAARAAV